MEEDKKRFKSILINKCSNGFVIRDGIAGECVTPVLEAYVFNSFFDMVEWLRENFEVEGVKGADLLNGGFAPIDIKLRLKDFCKQYCTCKRRQENPIKCPCQEYETM
jgi:hypothetical protein